MELGSVKVEAAGIEASDTIFEKRREVLHPLCNLCHNEIHGRYLKGNTSKPQLNEERW